MECVELYCILYLLTMAKHEIYKYIKIINEENKEQNRGQSQCTIDKHKFVMYVCMYVLE